MSIQVIRWNDITPLRQEAALARPAQHNNQDVSDRVREIIGSVRERGDAAIFELTKKLDGATLESFKAGPGEFDAAEAALSGAQIAAIDLSIRNVRQFHAAQLPDAVRVETMPGVRCERVSHPIDAVGLYVPAGTAPLPSTAIMLAVPAAIANCPTKVLCTPPRPDGTADSAVLVAAKRAGIRDVFKIGGAQAIAAMAFGTESVPRVAKIFGPGNAWVTEAKIQVAGDPRGAAIDMPAGPSEVLVIADGNANPEFIAADLLSQAEHGADSQVLLVTMDAVLAEKVVTEIDQQLAALSRREIAAASIANSRIIVTGDLESAIGISNRYAPEHLILHVDDPGAVMPDIRNAGSVFLGPWSPESVGDYCSGTNHVLPTYGYARSYSGLSVDQFMRHMTIQELSRDGLRSLSDAVISLAELEGLDGHAAAVVRRLNYMETME
jgi:histidinol dehydrogenase